MRRSTPPRRRDPRVVELERQEDVRKERARLANRSPPPRRRRTERQEAVRKEKARLANRSPPTRRASSSSSSEEVKQQEEVRKVKPPLAKRRRTPFTRIFNPSRICYQIVIYQAIINSSWIPELWTSTNEKGIKYCELVRDSVFGGQKDYRCRVLYEFIELAKRIHKDGPEFGSKRVHITGRGKIGAALQKYNVASRRSPGLRNGKPNVTNYGDPSDGGKELPLLMDLMNRLLKEAQALEWSIFNNAIYHTRRVEDGEYYWIRNPKQSNRHKLFRFEVAPKTLIIEEPIPLSVFSVDISLRKGDLRTREEVKAVEQRVAEKLKHGELVAPENSGEVHHYVNEKASQAGDIPYTIRSIILEDHRICPHNMIVCRDTSVPIDDDAAWYELQNYPDRDVRPMSTNQMQNLCKETKGVRITYIVYERLDL